MNFLLRFLGILSELTMFFFIDRLFGHRMTEPLIPYGTGYFSYVVVGMVCLSFAGMGMAGLPMQWSKEQAQGTLESLLLAPHPPLLLIIAMAAWNTFMASLEAFLYILGALVVFGVSFNSVNLVSLAVVGFLTVLTMNTLGLLDTALIIVFKRGHVVGYLMGLFWGILGGVYFPTSILPDWLERLAWFLPTTHAVQMMQTIIHRGSSLGELLPQILPLVVMAAFFLILGCWAMKQALRLAKIRGSFAYA